MDGKTFFKGPRQNKADYDNLLWFRPVCISFV